MGADQALYAYVGERVRAGGLPYRDAWDQKPPAIHFLYAGLRTLWPDDAVVPAADLAAAAAVAWLLYRLGGLAGPAGTGAAAALVFLLLSNPAFTRRRRHPPAVAVRDVHRRGGDRGLGSAAAKGRRGRKVAGSAR